MLKESQWLDVTEKSELDKYVREEDDEDGDMDFIPGDDMDVDEENFNPDDPGSMDASFNPESSVSTRGPKLDRRAGFDWYGIK